MKYLQFNIPNVTQFQQLIEESGLRHQKFMKELNITSYATWRARRNTPTDLTIRDVILIAQLIRCEPEMLFRTILNQTNSNG